MIWIVILPWAILRWGLLLYFGSWKYKDWRDWLCFVWRSCAGYDLSVAFARLSTSTRSLRQILINTNFITTFHRLYSRPSFLLIAAGPSPLRSPAPIFRVKGYKLPNENELLYHCWQRRLWPKSEIFILVNKNALKIQETTHNGKEKVAGSQF